jgi:acyl-[acyl-carrier-protein]-phospholipid O-acyltransferase/long-chain-fatty-acid--[acyl-carrier-protein] ligase
MSHSQFRLLATRRFLPLFSTQFMGAFNDNLFKQAVVVLITYALVQDDAHASLLVTMAGGIFILPFFLFSAFAGQLADKYDKSRMIRATKVAEVAFMGLAGFALYSENVTFLLTVLFLMGAQSAFFGPLKYGILPDHLPEDELLGGNALIETGTLLAILLGTILGGILILSEGGLGIVTAMLLAVAAAGLAASFFIPRSAPAEPGLKPDWNIFRSTWEIMAYSRTKREVFLSILGISWFWLIGFVFLTQIPTFCKDILGADESVVTLCFTLFSVGVAGGSMLCHKLLKGEIRATYVPASAIAITLFIFDLAHASSEIAPGYTLMGVREFLEYPQHWRIMLDLTAIAICGGVYVVPLYAIMQSHSEASHRARVVASNNVLNACFMVVSAVGSGTMLAVGFSVVHVFLAVAVLNTVAAFIICGLLPDAVVKSLVRWVLQFLFRVKVEGLEHYREAGAKTVIIANHVSFLDAVLLSAFLPDRLTFAVNTTIAKKWWMRPWVQLLDTCAIDPTNPMAMKKLIDVVKSGRRVVIFPEGRLTLTGALMKIYEGPGLIADKADAPLLPIRIEGAQYTYFTRLKGKLRRRPFPKLCLTVLPPVRVAVDSSLKSRTRRQLIGRQLYDLMTRMMFESSHYRTPLFPAIVDAAHTHGNGHIIAEDIKREPMSYGKLLRKSFLLGGIIERFTVRGEKVGILLPNMNATLVSFVALHAIGRVPAMLNFTAGERGLKAACGAVELKHILTSRAFLQQAKLEPLADKLKEAGYTVHALEDFKSRMTAWIFLKAFLRSLSPKLAWRLAARVSGKEQARFATGQPAVILYTSGSEGLPKGVALSHANLLANYQQVAARVDFGPGDVVLNILPMFHSFGLTGGTLLPLLSGIRTFFYPSPLHYRIVPELVYDSNATILFGTDTFLNGYARFAHPYDFYAIRYIFAGAEKLKDSTRRLYAEKFGVRIFEGYGATETSPVLAMNTPLRNRPGTVGALLPALEGKLEPVPGISEGGRLVVRGPNVMLGYYRAEKPGVLEAPEGGWYDTGDIASIDAEGYITLLGRAKRFAKIAGEMVSLTAVEALAQTLWPDAMHGVVNLPDASKGEQLVLFTTQADANREALLSHFRNHGMTELAVPKTVRCLEQLPVLGTGKADYVKLKEMAESGEGR